MSVIAAVTNGEKVWMGSDAASTGDISYLMGSKVFTVGSIVYGVCGDFDNYCAIVHGAKLPSRIINARSGGEINEPVELNRWAYHTVLPRLKEAVAKASIAEPCFSVLLGVNGRIITLDENSVTEDRRPYAAIGDGASFALGSLHTQLSKQGRRDYERILERSLESSVEFAPSCRAPIFIRGV
jgi:ATP-dependent protease HslVU (ClpYQ) peptidase subunit